MTLDSLIIAVSGKHWIIGRHSNKASKQYFLDSDVWLRDSELRGTTRSLQQWIMGTEICLQG